jgi:hypothetical protein
MKNQLIPFIVTFFGALLTLQYLYTITNQRELLIIVFLLIIVIVRAVRNYIVTERYPDRPDGLVNPRRAYLTSSCDIVVNVCVIILTRIVYDVLNSSRLKANLQWWNYMTFFALTLAFILYFVHTDY